MRRSSETTPHNILNEYILSLPCSSVKYFLHVFRFLADLAENLTENRLFALYDLYPQKSDKLRRLKRIDRRAAKFPKSIRKNNPLDFTVRQVDTL